MQAPLDPFHPAVHGKLRRPPYKTKNQVSAAKSRANAAKELLQKREAEQAEEIAQLKKELEVGRLRHEVVQQRLKIEMLTPNTERNRQGRKEGESHWASKIHRLKRENGEKSWGSSPKPKVARPVTVREGRVTPRMEVSARAILGPKKFLRPPLSFLHFRKTSCQALS